jgi:hypothetical protein
MGKLDADRRVLSPHESDQRLKAFDLGIGPDAEIVLVAGKMHEVEAAAGVSGLGAIVHHRRHREAILQRGTANRQRLEQHWPRRIAGTGWTVTHRKPPGRHREDAAKAAVDQPCMMRCKSVIQARERRDPASELG